MRNAIIFGANSTIAKAVIEKLAVQGYNLFLLARNSEELLTNISDFVVKYPGLKIKSYSYNAEIDSDIQANLDAICAEVLIVDLVLVAHGSLPVQDECSNNLNTFISALDINGISAIKICHRIALKMKEQRHGTIAVISSVAGERGRQSNYAYGTAKGMLNVYLQGLRNELCKYNVHVLTIMPGFVDTRMTKDFKKGILWAAPQKVAGDIVTAINKKKDIIYTPWFWAFIMRIIKLIPESKFKTMKL